MTDNGLTGLSNYFAVSLTYKQQGTLVLKNAKTQGFATPADSSVDSDNIKGAKAKWAIVTANTPNFAGARAAASRPRSTPRTSRTRTTSSDQNGDYQSAADAVRPDSSRSGRLQDHLRRRRPGLLRLHDRRLLQAPAAQADWVGPGVTYTEVTVAQYICDQTKNEINGHAWFLAPAPALDQATSDFKAAYKNNYDDIEWALWGLSNSLLEPAEGRERQPDPGELHRLDRTRVAARRRLHADRLPAQRRPLRRHRRVGRRRSTAPTTEPDQNQPGGWDTVGSTYLRLT